MYNVRNEEIMKNADMKDIVTTIRKMKIKGAGPLGRMEKNKKCKYVTEWTPDEHRRRLRRPGER